MSMSSPGLLEKTVCLEQCVSPEKNCISPCSASLCIPRPNLPVIPGISRLPTFVFQSLMMKRISSLVLVLVGAVCLHRKGQLQLLWHQWLEHCLIFVVLNGLP